MYIYQQHLMIICYKQIFRAGKSVELIQGLGKVCLGQFFLMNN